MSFFTALRFLTVIPLPGRHSTSLAELGRSIIYFPAVGMVIGFVLIGLSWLLRLILPSEVANMLIIVSLTVITGALHLDGLADTCDGIAGHKTVEERWQVMHDSRVGGYGIVGVCILLLAKYVLLNSISVNLLMVTLVLMPVLSRWAMVFALFIYPYARPAGLGLEFKKATNWRRFSLATVITLAVALGLTGWLNNAYSYLAVLAVMGGTWIIIMILAAYLKHKFAGLTGDTYGAISEVAEVVVLIMVSLLAYNHWLV